MKSRRSRSTVVSLFTALILLAGLLVLPNLHAGAQSDPPAGVTMETISSLQIPVDRTETLQTMRITFDPGTRIALAHHSGTVIVSVGSGELTVSVADGDALLTRQGSTARYAVEPGKRYTLDPGDKLTFGFTDEADVMQNLGFVPLVLDATFVSQNAQPDFAPAPETHAVRTAGRCIACH